MQGSLFQCHFRHPFRQNYHMICAFFFTTGAVYEDPKPNNFHKRLHLYTVINSKKSEGRRFKTLETSFQVSLSFSSSGSEKVVHGLLIQKRSVQ